MAVLVAATAFLAATVVLTACTGQPDRLAGSGSVTTNGIKGTLTRDGLPAAGVKVDLYPTLYDPRGDSALGAKYRQVTDHSGRFAFADVDSGTFNLVAGAGTAFGARVTLSAIRGTANLDNLPLLPAGSIRVRLPEDAREAGAYVYLPGSGTWAAPDSADLARGEISLSPVPPGTYAAVEYVPWASGHAPRNLLDTPIGVGPEGTATVYPYGAWKHKVRIVLNASPSGADVKQGLRGFPLLVRLDAGNFDFSAAEADGKDLRVTAADSATLLPVEFESWDAKAKSAALWVRLDSVRAGDTGQTFWLFSGNASAGARPPAAVFDTADGFTAVWHLDGAPDLSQHAYPIIPSAGLGPESKVAGVIGNAMELDGKDDWLQLPNSDKLISAGMALTLSAWIRPAAPVTGDSIRYRLASFRNDTAGISDLAFGMGEAGRLSHYTRAEDSVRQWGPVLGADSLHHVALTLAGGTFTGYVDGVAVYSGPGSLLPAGALPAYLGAHLPGNRLFQGLIDEFRIEHAARSPDWLKLSVATQRPGAGCVRVAP